MYCHSIVLSSRHIIVTSSLTFVARRDNPPAIIVKKITERGAEVSLLPEPEADYICHGSSTTARGRVCCAVAISSMHQSMQFLILHVCCHLC